MPLMAVKRHCFKKALDAYVQRPAGFIAKSLQEPSAVKVINGLLTQTASMLTEENHAVGCLVTKGALACSTEAADMQALLSGYRNTIELKLRQRFEHAKLEGDLSVATDAVALAKLVMTLHQGMSVQAVSRTTQPELLLMATQLIEAYVGTEHQVST